MSDKNKHADIIATTAFFTGHRILSDTEEKYITEKLFQCISGAYTEGYRSFYCGCALGFDTIAAYQVIRLRQLHPDVRLILAIPCKNQPDLWAEKDKAAYQKILDASDEIIILSSSYYPGVMQTRNRYMADRSSLCICYLRYMHGGTASTVRYALLNNRMRIINLAVNMEKKNNIMRENAWNYTFISLSAKRNAVTAPLRLMSRRKHIIKNMSTSSLRKQGKE